MAGFTVDFYYTTKRYNSTAQTYMATKKFSATEVVLKHPCDIVHPIFIIDRTKVAQASKDAKVDWSPNFAEINWCHCGDPGFLRYYFISRVVYVTNYLVEIHCDCDVLASHLNIIQDLDAFVVYTSDKKQADCSIDDARLHPEKPAHIGIKSVYKNAPKNSNIFTFDSNEWCYALTCTALATGAGTIITYIIKPSVFQDISTNIVNYINGIPTSTNIGTVMACVLKNLSGTASVTDYIHSVRLLPIKYDKIDITEQNIVIGAIQMVTGTSVPGGSGTYVDAKAKSCIGHKMYFAEYNGFNLPKDGLIPEYAVGDSHNPDGAASDPYFLRGSKYCCWYFKHPGGLIPIQSDTLCRTDMTLEVDCRMALNMATGNYTIDIWNPATEDYLGGGSGSVGVEINLFAGGGGLMDYGLNTIRGVIKAGTAALSLNDAKVPIKNPERKTTETENTESNESNSDNSGNSGKVKTKTSSSKNFSDTLGVLGEFFAGSHALGNPGFGLSEGFINLRMSCSKYDAQGTDTFDIDNIFQFIGEAQLPAICFDSDQYEAYATLRGYPCSKMLKIKNIKQNNYIECAGADISMGMSGGFCMFPEEVTQINTFLNTGFYYEDNASSKKDDVAEKASL